MNHAAITYGGGVTANLSGGASTTYDPIYLIDARPTVTFNTIALSQHAAISADPDSFEQSEFYGDQGTQTDPAIPYTNDYDREGPLVHGNAVSDDVINGLFVRIATSTSGTNAGAPLDMLTVPAVFAATDITYVITENLYIQGQVGGPVNGDLRTAASNGLPIEGQVQIDPGVVLKLLDAHIEVQPDWQLIAEGTDADPVVITSLYDTTYGAGGTFRHGQRTEQGGQSGRLGRDRVPTRLQRQHRPADLLRRRTDAHRGRLRLLRPHRDPPGPSADHQYPLRSEFGRSGRRRQR